MKRLLLFPVLLCLYSSCKKDSPQSANKSEPLSISSINPTSGHPGDEITISGTGFNTTANNSTVKFNNVIATVLSAGSTSLKVKVPIGAGDGPVTITTATGTATSPSFTYIPDVIAVGTVQSSAQVVALYWKNGEPVRIDSSVDLYIRSMTVSGSDVYLSGYEYNGTVMVAKYWKNTVATNLSDGTQWAEAYSVVVVANDVYVAGSESNGTHSIAKYWKNKVPLTLTDGSQNAHAYSIAVVGSDIYVAGDEQTPSGSVIAKYWKNGVPISLPDSDPKASAYSIALSGNDTYITGWDEDSTGLRSAQTWKNSILTNIPNRGNITITSLKIISDNVYMSGSEFGGTTNTAKYWKNGTGVSLTDGSYTANTHDIAVYGNDVYVAGEEHNGLVYKGKYWKNGVATSLSNGSGNTILWGIVVR